MGDAIFNLMGKAIKLLNNTDGTFSVGVATAESKVNKVFVITASDEENLTHTTTGLYVGETGDIKVDFSEEGEGIIIKGLAAGVWHPIQVKKVYATGTGAASILGAY